MGLEGGLSGATALSEVGGGIVAGLLGDGDVDEIVGLVAKNMLLNALPLYGLGQALAFATETIAREIQGEPNLPLVGWLLAPGATLAQAKGVTLRVLDAALWTSGWDPWLRKDFGDSPLKRAIPSAVRAQLRDWLGDLNRDLNSALRYDGAAEIELMLATNATRLRELHLAVALNDWATAAGWVPYGYAILAPGSTLPPTPGGATASTWLKPQLKGAPPPPPRDLPGAFTKRAQLYKAMGVAPYSVYAQALAPNLAAPGAGAPLAQPATAVVPPDEPKIAAGVAAVVMEYLPGLPQSAFSTLGGALSSLGGLAGSPSALSSSAGPTTSPAFSTATAAPRSSSLLLLALAGLALAAWLVLAAKSPA